MAAIESDYGHYFNNSSQNYLHDFLRRRHGLISGTVPKHWDHETNKLDGIDDFYVTQRHVDGGRLLFEIHAVNDKEA
jgi:hypothetical protein